MSFRELSRGRQLSDLKARQAAKLRELKEALVTAGVTTLDEQAQALGLGRSTTWTILHGNHKASGLSARTVNRVLAAPRLLPQIQTKILEYVKEKATGEYGHGDLQRHLFIAQISLKRNGQDNP